MVPRRRQHKENHGRSGSCAQRYTERNPNNIRVRGEQLRMRTNATTSVRGGGYPTYSMEARGGDVHVLRTEEPHQKNPECSRNVGRKGV